MNILSIDRSLHLKLIDDYCIAKNIRDYSAYYYTSGANNVLYRLQSVNIDSVIKIGVNPAYRKLHVEAAVLDNIKKVTPELLDFCVDEKTGTEMIVQPFVKGNHILVPDDLQIKTMAKVVEYYHAFPERLTVLDVEGKNVFLQARTLPVNRNDDNFEFYNRFKDLFVKAGILSDKTRRPNDDLTASVLVHGDLIPLNMMFCGDCLQIIDWESARYDDPESDIVTLFKGYKLDERQQCLFKESYALPLNQEKLNLRMVLHILQVISWRLAFQLVDSIEDDAYEKVKMEIEVEFTEAERLLSFY